MTVSCCMTIYSEVLCAEHHLSTLKSLEVCFIEHLSFTCTMLNSGSCFAVASHCKSWPMLPPSRNCDGDAPDSPDKKEKVPTVFQFSLLLISIEWASEYQQTTCGNCRMNRNMQENFENRTFHPQKS